MDYTKFAQIDINTKKVIQITDVETWRVLNEFNKVDFRLSNDYLKSTIPHSISDYWLEVSEEPGKQCGLDYTYDENYEAFIPPKPFDSWILNTETFRWDPPVPMPELFSDTKLFYPEWNEETLTWDVDIVDIEDDE